LNLGHPSVGTSGLYEEVATQVPQNDGFPISKLISIIAKPVLMPLKASLEAEQWDEIRKNYETLIDTCNRCHSSTEHEYIVITPTRGGDPPFNQRFDVP
jgi:hypothetical protein